MSEISFVDLHRHFERYESEFRAAMDKVLMASHYVRGEEVDKFEKEFSAAMGVRRAVSCGSGTDALCLALRGLGLSEGDEVITTALTFCATAEAIVVSGLKPVFADIDPETFCIDANSIESLITERTRAILPVHLYGHPCDMQQIVDIARRHNLFVVEDVAQASGGTAVVDGKRQRLGTIGVAGCTSFFPTKNLACFGDGGAVFTNDEALADKARMIANHGSEKKYHNEMIGINSRLDTIQAAVLRVNLAHLDQLNAERREAAEHYSRALCKIDGIVAPKVVDGHVFHCYVIRVLGGKRDELKAFLASKGIPTMVHYPVPVHRLPAYLNYCDRSLPMAEKASAEVLSLPMSPGITSDEIETVIKAIELWKRK